MPEAQPPPQPEPIADVQPDTAIPEAIPETNVTGEPTQAEDIPVSDGEREHIDIPVDNGMDDELVTPSPVTNQPEQSMSRRRHTRRKPDSSRLNEASPPE